MDDYTQIHIPVLFNETIDALCIRPDGIYVDATGGAGGHSSAILERLTTGRLIIFDQDPEAIEILKKRFGDDGRVTIVHKNFVYIKEVLESLGIEKVNGVTADLGVSSLQLDKAERGFSFHKDAPLDMRQNTDEGMSAKDLVNTATQQELQRIIYEFGEERYAASIARNIVKVRENNPIETTFQLVDIIKMSMPAKAQRDGHPARRTFMSLRIAVNNELDVLDRALDDMFDVLAPGGRLAVITFHSTEDRITKRHFADYCRGCVCKRESPVCTCGRTPRGKLPFKSVAPAKDEVESNFRSHSARLRAVEKL